MRPIWKSKESFSTSSDVSDEIEKEEEVAFLGGVGSRKSPKLGRVSLPMCCWTIFNLIFSTILLIAHFSSPGRGRNSLLKMTSFYCEYLKQFRRTYTDIHELLC
jgi:hypothetical protein